MDLQKEGPALGAAAGLPELSSFGGDDTRDTAPKPGTTQGEFRNPLAVRAARRELVCDDLVANISQASLHFDVALGMLAARDDVGLLYSLRRVRAYWKAISESAQELGALNAEVPR